MQVLVSSSYNKLFQHFSNALKVYVSFQENNSFLNILVWISLVRYYEISNLGCFKLIEILDNVGI